jgi:hypothetical protein
MATSSPGCSSAKHPDDRHRLSIAARDGLTHPVVAPALGEHLHVEPRHADLFANVKATFGARILAGSSAMADVVAVCSQSLITEVFLVGHVPPSPSPRTVGGRFHAIVPATSRAVEPRADHYQSRGARASSQGSP